jgi:hypothetical protein
MIVIEFREAGTTGEYYSGITHNCSVDGFIFESETLDLLSGTVLDMKLKHPERDETISCSGDVVWTKKQKYGFIGEVKLHSVPTEKQNILAEIISLSPPPADSATRKELKPVQSPSVEDPDSVQNESYSDRITESIVSAVWKNSAEETGSTEERDISESVSPEVRTEKSGSASKVKNGQGKLSPALITVLVVAAFAVLAGYLIHNSSTESLQERLSSLLMSRNTVSEVLPKDREDQPSRLAPTEAGEGAVDPSPDSLDKPEKTETGIVVIEEKINTDPGFNQEVTDLIPDEDSSFESLNKGPETGETVAGERFIIHVSAWKTKKYAMSINKKVMSFYPDAITVFQNNYHIVMVPNISSHEKALSISEELAYRFNVSPLIYVQQHNVSEINKNDKALP